MRKMKRGSCKMFCFMQVVAMYLDPCISLLSTSEFVWYAFHRLSSYSLRNCKTAHHPPNVSSSADLIIDGDWATTGGKDKQPFKFYDNGTDATSRLILFGSRQCLQVLSSASMWFMDGNFSLAPSPFTQVRPPPSFITSIVNFWLKLYQFCMFNENRVKAQKRQQFCHVNE